MNIKIKKIVPCCKAFSFIESMLAVFLVSVGLVAAVGLLSASLKNTLSARDQFVASLLAQEGVELVRNIRDNNWVDNNPATTSFDINSGFWAASKTCLISYNNSLVCGGPSLSTPLNLDVNKYYTTNAGTPTKFERTILISYDAANLNVRTVTSMVIWSGQNFKDIPIPGTANKCTSYQNCIDYFLPICNTANQCAYTQITLNNWGE